MIVFSNEILLINVNQLKINPVSMKTSKREQLLAEMRSEARAHNKFLTLEYLKPLTPRILAALTLPDNRREYLDRLRLIELEEAQEMQEKDRVAKRNAEGLRVRPSIKKRLKSKITENINLSAPANLVDSDMAGSQTVSEV
jgi:hypothetical protein